MKTTVRAILLLLLAPAVTPGGAAAGDRHYFLSASGSYSRSYGGDGYFDAGGGCLGNTSGATLDWAVDLPVANGETITAVRFYFRDDDTADDLTFAVRRVDINGTLSVLAGGASSGAPGQTTLTLPLSHTVHQETGGVFVTVDQAHVAGGEVCGLRVETSP